MTIARALVSILFMPLVSNWGTTQHSLAADTGDTLLSFYRPLSPQAIDAQCTNNTMKLLLFLERKTLALVNHARPSNIGDNNLLGCIYPVFVVNFKLIV